MLIELLASLLLAYAFLLLAYHIYMLGYENGARAAHKETERQQASKPEGNDSGK